MTNAQPTPSGAAAAAEPAWHVVERDIDLRGRRYRVRLTAFESRGWLASVDTADGPTLGANRSPYLAAAAALEPLSGTLTDAMRLLGPRDALTSALR